MFQIFPSIWYWLWSLYRWGRDSAKFWDDQKMKSYEGDEEDPGLWEGNVDCQEEGCSKFIRLKMLISSEEVNGDVSEGGSRRL